MAIKITPKTIAGGVAAYMAAAVGAMLYMRGQKAKETAAAASAGSAEGAAQGSGASAARVAGDHRAAQLEPGIWSKLASCYDGAIERDEMLMGLKLMRWWLIRKAQGDVLEVSAGTGRNLKYYDLWREGSGITSLTITDSNREMLQQSYDKMRSMKAEPHAPVRFTLADAEALTSSDGTGSQAAAAPAQQQQQQQQQQLSGGFQAPQLATPERFAPASFDYVVDTFGLCSCPDPVKALQEMARVCKPGGRLLLLQHGRGTWNFINGILDGGEEAHCKKWGCQWNRPIEELIEQAGLEVDASSRWHFGTTYVIEARPRAPGAGQRQA